MDLRDYLAAIRRSWPLLVIPVVLGLVAAIVALGMQTPKYLSTAKVIVSVGNAANANDLSQANAFAQSAAANFAALAEQPYVLSVVREQLGLRLTADQIAEELTTSVEESTSIIAIDVLDPSRDRAARIADATANELSAAVAQLNPSAADGTQNVKVTVVRTAVPATKASVPNRPLGLALGLLGGLLLGVVLVILRELLDTRIRSTPDLQQLSGAPVVGQIPRTSSMNAAPLVLAADSASAAAEGFRLLQLNLEYLRAPASVVTVGIASAVPSEGKSTVAANLALALAAAGHRVALVDADLRRPRLHGMFGIEGGLGLTEVLIGRADLTDVVQPWGSEEMRIAILPAGTTPPNPGELLQSPRMSEVLDRLAEDADVVLVDGPPLLAVADSAVLASTVDAVLLVASMRRSHRGPVARAVSGLEGLGVRVLGTVATMTRPSRADSDAYLRYTRGAPRAQTVRPPRSLRAPVSADTTIAGETDVARVEAQPAPARAPEPNRRAAASADAAEQPAPLRDEPDPRAAAAEPDRTARKVPAPRSAGLPVRLPVTGELDSRTQRTLRRRISAKDLRILRSFAHRSGSPYDR